MLLSSQRSASAGDCQVLGAISVTYLSSFTQRLKYHLNLIPTFLKSGGYLPSMKSSSKKLNFKGLVLWEKIRKNISSCLL